MVDRFNNGEKCKIKMIILFYNSVLSQIELHRFETLLDTNLWNYDARITE